MFAHWTCQIWDFDRFKLLIWYEVSLICSFIEFMFRCECEIWD